MDENTTSPQPAPKSGNAAVWVVVIIVIAAVVGFFAVKGNKDSESTGGQNNSGSVAGENTPQPAPTPPVSSPSVKEITVTGSNFKFDPAEIKVKKGDTVKITFVNSSGFHDWVLDEFNVKTKQFMGPGQEIVEFVADKAGSFEYYCSVGTHRQMGMKGKLIVEE